MSYEIAMAAIIGIATAVIAAHCIAYRVTWIENRKRKK